MVGGISYRPRGKVLAPASFAISSNKTEEDCSQELNERMHRMLVHPKKNMTIVDARGHGQKLIMAFLSKRSHCKH